MGAIGIGTAFNVPDSHIEIEEYAYGTSIKRELFDGLLWPNAHRV